MNPAQNQDIREKGSWNMDGQWFKSWLKPQPFSEVDNNGVSNGDCLSMAKSKVVREAIKMLESNELVIKNGNLGQGLLTLNSCILKLLREG